MKNKNILISGAGIAGLTLAYWLRRYGFNVTLVERALALRSGGYKVDIRGSALTVIERMDLHNKIYAQKTDIQGATIIDHMGTTISETSGDTFGFREGDDLEIMRGDLSQILVGELKDVECLFGDCIVDMVQDSEGVNVVFLNSEARRFDLVIGADGLHSTVRKLSFGDEHNFAHDLGMYICIYTVPNNLKLDRREIEYADSDKLVDLYSSRGDDTAKAAFLFSSQNLRIDARDTAAQQAALVSVYSGIGWDEMPRLLASMTTAPDFYFDSVTQIKMDCWSNGRVALVGDAGYCAAPVSGQGTSLALVGAYVLAGELAAASGDYVTAFDRYQQQLQTFVQKNQALGVAFVQNMTTEAESVVSRVADAANAITLKAYEAL